MKKAFRFLFNLYPGDARKVSLFLILAFLWGTGSYGTLTLSEGLFLEHVGAAHLPITYVYISLTLCTLSSLLILALNRFSIRHLLIGVISFWVVSNTCFYSLFHYFGDSTPLCVWYLFKVMGWVTPLSTYICYWAFVDQYFHLQDAKRFFGLFNAVTFLGDACGGGCISFGMSALNVGGLLITFTTLLLASLPFILLIHKRRKPILEAHVETIDSTSSFSLKEIAKKVIKSPFTLYLLLFYFAMQLLAIVTEYSYMSLFETTYKHIGEHQLTEFLGTCALWISLSNMFFGIFVYGRLVKKMGVNNIIMIAPSFFLAVFLGWFYKESLFIAVCAMVVREGMVYSLDDNNLNLLISGVPTKIKNQVRISVESFFEPAGMLLSALLLLVVYANVVLGLSLAVLSLIISFFLRHAYPKAIFQNLVSYSIRFGKKAIDWIPQNEKKRFEHHLLIQLKTQQEQEQFLAFEYLLKLENKHHLPRLIDQMSLWSLPSRVKAIELLNESVFAKEAIVLQKLSQWQKTLPHPHIRSAIHFYLSHHKLLKPDQVIHDLEAPHVELQGAAILAMKTMPKAHSFPSHAQVASKKLEALLQSKIDGEKCIGLKVLGLGGDKEQIDTLFNHLQSSSKEVVREALLGIKRLAEPSKKESAHQLIPFLSKIKDPESRKYCLEAIFNFQNKKIIKPLILETSHFRPIERKQVEEMLIEWKDEETLLSLVKDSLLPDKARLLSGKALAKLAPKKLKKALSPLLEKEIARAHFYFYHAHSISKQMPEADLEALENALFAGFYSILDFIIQMIGSADHLEESEVLSHALRSSNQKTQSQAYETLEKACDKKLFLSLEPLLYHQDPLPLLQRYIRDGRSPFGLSQLLDFLSHSPSTPDQITAFAMKARFHLPNWKQEMQERLNKNEEIFHHFAQELLGSV